MTLLFSVGRYAQAARAYQRGLARRAGRGEAIDRVRSVASVFVSRVDARIEQVLGEDNEAPPGAFGIANAHVIHQCAVELFAEPGWQALVAHGAHWQRPLWASTAPKNPELRDVAYVEALAFPDTIVTVPEKTLLAFADHGNPQLAVSDEREASGVVDTLTRKCVDLETVGEELETAGVRAFADAYAEVLEHLEQRAHHGATTAARS